MVSDQDYFRSRDPKHVYYESQIESKQRKAIKLGSYSNLSRIALEREKFDVGIYRSFYKQKPTKRFQKFLKLQAKVNQAAELSLNFMEKLLSKLA